MFELMGWKKRDWNFVGMRYGAFAFSGVLIAIGLYAIVMMGLGKGKMGIDFVGGLTMNVAIDKVVSLDDIRKGFVVGGIGEAEIQQIQSATGQRLLIKLRKSGQDKDVQALLTKIAVGAVVTVEGVQEVGPAVGEKLREQAAWAVLWAIILITVYIWFRFEYRFGIAAAIATAHDVIAMIGFAYVMDKDFTMLIVTALLTLAGYSLTDTVVVFDRIRENLRLMHKQPFNDIVNKSINEILSRTFVTSLTVLLPLIAIMIYGSHVTYDFAMVLIAGIVIGTYSSWFVASPILVEWEHRKRLAAVAMAAASQNQPKR